jgi:hypothetical protein
MAKGLDADEFRSVMDELISAVDQFRLSMTGADAATIERADEERLGAQMARENTRATQANTNATKEETKAKKLASGIVNFFASAVSAAAREALNVGNAGFKLAETLGTSATRGVQLEISNRKALFNQLGRVSTDLSVSMDQLNAAQTGFTEAFVGLREGTQISAEGSRAFAQDLKQGFGSEFKATPETFRILTQMGMSSARQMDNFRKATGQASLSSGQLATLYNKNTLSFLLYGNSFGKAAVQAEKLGINLASIQAAQEGLVTNLDGTIDTVAQINQLGGQIDFGNLVRIAEQEGPDALLAYVRATVPEQLMQSASTRALFKQLGISVEDYMKSGQKQVSAAEELEKRMTETATASDALTHGIAGTTRANNILEDAFGDLARALKDAIAGLGRFVKDLIIAGITAKLASIGGARGGAGGGGGGMSALGRIGMGLTGLSIGRGGATAGAALVEQGKTKTGVATGAGLGALGAFLTGVALLGAIPTGGASLALLAAGTAAGGIGAGAYAYSAGRSAREERAREMGMTIEQFDEFQRQQRQPVIPAQDLLSTPGYGQRTLVTPKGTFALNNADTLLAGTNLFGQNTNVQSTRERNDNTVLVRKIDELITMLSTATTTINVNGSVQRVPRMQLVGVYSRNEVV